MNKIRQIFSREQEDEQGIIADIESGFSLSWSTRLKLFIGFFVSGIVLSILGSFFFWFLSSYSLFAIFYTLGNICSIGSTVFLMGPVNQIKRMFQETRIFAAVIMLVSLALTLCFAFLRIPLLCFLFCIIQSLALTWYSLSYIPFARDAVKRICTSCVC